jgi:hypothetical protein
MLKGIIFSGKYCDEYLTVSVTSEEPLSHGLDSGTLSFSFTIKESVNTDAPRTDDFTFYLMDEADRLYNTRLERVIPADTLSRDAREPNPLILAEFKPDFLYQDLRVAFYCRSRGIFGIITLMS